MERVREGGRSDAFEKDSVWKCGRGTWHLCGRSSFGMFDTHIDGSCAGSVTESLADQYSKCFG
eukprot:3443183-Amphidinium_carterae.2